MAGVSPGTHPCARLLLAPRPHPSVGFFIPNPKEKAPLPAAGAKLRVRRVVLPAGATLLRAGLQHLGDFKA